ncbi:MAG: hypothetical protein D6736_18145 [Nitrospinota bacterium]|nr:MAG: hypothetical protein D6736_18145 [Nitrospinota bacterium]
MTTTNQALETRHKGPEAQRIYSVLVTHYSLLITHYSLLITHYSLLTPSLGEGVFSDTLSRTAGKGKR